MKYDIIILSKNILTFCKTTNLESVILTGLIVLVLIEDT